MYRQWSIPKGGVTVNNLTKINLAIELGPGDSYTGDPIERAIEYEAYLDIVRDRDHLKACLREFNVDALKEREQREADLNSEIIRLRLVLRDICNKTPPEYATHKIACDALKEFGDK